MLLIFWKIPIYQKQIPYILKSAVLNYGTQHFFVLVVCLYGGDSGQFFLNHVLVLLALCCGWPILYLYWYFPSCLYLYFLFVFVFVFVFLICVCMGVTVARFSQIMSSCCWHCAADGQFWGHRVWVTFYNHKLSPPFCWQKNLKIVLKIIRNCSKKWLI